MFDDDKFIHAFDLRVFDGDAKVGSTRATIDAKFRDVLDDLSYGFEVRMEAWKGKWGVTLDPSFLVLENIPVQCQLRSVT